MIEILEFVFSGFWVWLGTVILLAIVAMGAVGIFEAIFTRNNGK